MQKSIDKIYYAAIYLRLSKEDGDLSSGEKKESNSIANQRKLIEDYLSRNPEITLVQEFCDDGYTGANFDRPDFQRMIPADISRRFFRPWASVLLPSTTTTTLHSLSR